MNLFPFTGGPCGGARGVGDGPGGGGAGADHLVAVGNGGRGVLTSCGRDRQVLHDLHPVRVVVPGDGDPQVARIEALLPGAFRCT